MSVLQKITGDKVGQFASEAAAQAAKEKAADEKMASLSAGHAASREGIGTAVTAGTSTDAAEKTYQEWTLRLESGKHVYAAQREAFAAWHVAFDAKVLAYRTEALQKALAPIVDAVSLAEDDIVTMIGRLSAAYAKRDELAEKVTVLEDRLVRIGGDPGKPRDRNRLLDREAEAAFRASHALGNFMNPQCGTVEVSFLVQRPPGANALLSEDDALAS